MEKSIQNVTVQGDSNKFRINLVSALYTATTSVQSAPKSGKRSLNERSFKLQAQRNSWLSPQATPENAFVPISPYVCLPCTASKSHRSYKFEKKNSMADILHRIGIKTTSIDQVYLALTTSEGLAGWWTSNTNGEGNQVGNTIEFRFGAGGFDMKVTELKAPTLVVWQLANGPEEWMDTTISFELKQDGDYVILLFKHQNWKEPAEFMHHCSTKWAIFLMSLKSLIETGKGNPDPHDVKIDNWN